MVRYLEKQTISDLRQKMVFVGGPRQVGKTTMAQQILENLDGEYLNWDIPEHRDQILRSQLPDSRFWVFDELHKYDRWRDFLKALFDKFGKDRKILVTGSARLDYYRFSGDSLQGRYHYLRLHPFSVRELEIKDERNLIRLWNRGGFPEPYLADTAIDAKRWSAEYRKRLVEEEVRTLENIKTLGSLELLATRLPKLVGSTLSINALREDLGVSHKALTHCIEILERLYHIFRIYPFGSPRIRAVKKESKHFHFDWSLVKNDGARYENMVACHLLKWVHYRQDTRGDDIELRYFRDTDQREVDFAITEDQEPTLFVECKLNDTEISKHLVYLKKKFPAVEAVQVVMFAERKTIDKYGIKVVPAIEFLNELI